MKNTFILSCLLICPLSFASQPLPAAGAGAAAQSQASQIDVQAIQEKYDKNKKALAELVAKMHQACGAVELKQSDEEFKKSKENTLREYKNEKWKAYISWRAKPTANNEWIDEQRITLKSSTSFITITTHYSLKESSSEPVILQERGVERPHYIFIKEGPIVRGDAKDMDELGRIFTALMRSKELMVLNLLAMNGELGALSLIINNQFVNLSTLT